MKTTTKPDYWAGHRRALLIDLDNITITSRGSLAADETERLLRSVQAAAGPADWTIAVAPERSIHRYGSVLARLNIRWKIVPCLPDAADAEIVSIARELAGHGYSDYVVASADGYFAEIAAFGSLLVVSRTGQPVSRRLRRAAARLVAA